ncbi:MAG: hypothetical protein ACI8RP_001010 [Urechidicola sp.]|jgi:hypothetical protein
MEQNNSDEIDLGIVFNKIKNAFKYLLVRLFEGGHFLINHWWRLLLVIIIGGVVGYFLEESYEPNKEATLIVQNNFNSSNYVYNAIEQLNRKIKDGDTLFLEKLGFRIDTLELNGIEINPIVNIIELIKKSDDNDRSLEQFLQQADFEEDLLISEVFRSEYRFHKINISTSSYGNQKTITNVLKYLNNNSILNEIKNVIINDTKENIEINKKTIASIDQILNSFPKLSEKQDLKSNQLYVSTGSNYTDLAELVKSKSTLVSQNKSLKTELVKFNDIVEVINNPEILNETRSINLNSTKGIAFIFLMNYFLFFLLKSIYFKIKQFSEEIN